MNKKQIKKILNIYPKTRLLNQFRILIPKNQKYVLKKDEIIDRIIKNANNQFVKAKIQYFRQAKDKQSLSLNNSSFILNQKEKESNKQNLSKLKFQASSIQKQIFQKIADKDQTKNNNLINAYQKVISKQTLSFIGIPSYIQKNQILQFSDPYQVNSFQAELALSQKNNKNSLFNIAQNLLNTWPHRFEKIRQSNFYLLKKKQMSMHIHMLYSINKELDFQENDQFQKFIQQLDCISLDWCSTTKNIIECFKQIKLNLGGIKNISKNTQKYQQILEYCQPMTLSLILKKIYQSLNEQQQYIQILSEKMLVLKLIFQRNQFLQIDQLKDEQIDLLNKIIRLMMSKILINTKASNNSQMFNFLKIFYQLKLIQNKIKDQYKEIRQQFEKSQKKVAKNVMDSICKHINDLQIQKFKQFYHMVYYMYDEVQIGFQAKTYIEKISDFIKKQTFEHNV